MAAVANNKKEGKESAAASSAASASASASTGWNAGFAKVFGKTFVDNKGKEYTDEHFKGKHVAIYFSAHWCPPCRAFTPELVKTYNAMKKTKSDFEFVFVSWDRELKSFQGYFNDMPWLAVPYADAARRKALNEHYGVDGIPSLVVVSPTGETVTKNGRMAAVFDPTGANFPWPPKPIDEISPATIRDINDQATFLLFLDDVNAKVADAAVVAVRPLAVDVLADSSKTGGNTELTFLYGKSHPVAPKIRQFVNAGTAAVVILDIPNRCKYVLAVKAEEVTDKAVRDFYASWKKGTAKREALNPPPQQDDD